MSLSGRQRRRGLRAPVALLLCLLALSSSGARAQSLFDLLTGGNAPATAAPATTAQPAATTAQPAATTAQPAAAAADPATTPAGANPATTPAGASPATTAAAANPATTPAAANPATVPAGANPTTTPAGASPATVPAGASPATVPAGANPATTPAGASPATVPAGANPATVPAGASPAAQALNAGAVQAGTPAVAAPNGSDAAAVAAVGTVGTAAAASPPPSGDGLPPAPPEAWQALQKDVSLVFDVEIRGKYIIPFTSPKAKVIARVLRDRYLRSATMPDITVAALSTFTYWAYDSPDGTADAATPAGNRRRLLSRLGWGGAGRDLLQLEKSGAELKITVATNQVRVPSEMASFEEGVTSGQMAADFTLAGIDTENLTMLAAPFTTDLIGPGNTEETNDSMQAWVIAVIVGVVLLVVPVPLYLFVRWRKRKNKEAAVLQAAEAEAARARMQSRIMRPGSKSFSLKPGGSGAPSADIMVRSGSMGGLAGFHNNGRLASWTGGSPDRFYQGQFAISRQTSVTSMGSAMPSARSFGGQRQGVPPFASPIAIPPGAYEEELEAARTARSERGA